MNLIQRMWRKAIYNVSFAYWTAPLWTRWFGRRLTGQRIPRSIAAGELDLLDRGELSIPQRQVRTVSSSPIRLVSWNICYGWRLDQILRVMREELKADIYLLQEVDWNCGRSGHLHVASTLARELSHNYVFGPEFQELAQQGPDGTAFHGQAILSRFEIRSPRLLRFQSQPADWSSDTIQPRIGGRMALSAEIPVGDRLVIVYNAHLENRCREGERVAQFRELLSDIVSRGGREPTLIAGDLNTVEHGTGRVSPIVQEATQAGFRQFFCRWKGDRKTGRQVALDWVFARGFEAISATSCLGRHASDHDPVCVEFSIPEGAGRRS